MFKNLDTKILSSIFVLICVIIIAATFTINPLNKFAKALTGNYGASKTQLTASDWQNLPTDFLARNGGNSMGVDLDMGGHGITNIGGDLNMGTHKVTNLAAPTVNNDAVTLSAMNTAIAGVSGVIKNTSGTNLKMICGKMPLTNLNTVNPYDWTLRVTVDTSAANFTNVYSYIAGMDGLGNHYRVTGSNTIYVPFANNSFTMYLQYYDPFNPSYLIRVSDAITWGWTVSWCGLGTTL